MVSGGVWPLKPNGANSSSMVPLCHALWPSRKTRVPPLYDGGRDKEDLFVCGISLTSGQLVSELFPDCTRSCFSQVVLRRSGGDRIYVCLFVCLWD